MFEESYNYGAQGDAAPSTQRDGSRDPFIDPSVPEDASSRDGAPPSSDAASDAFVESGVDASRDASASDAAPDAASDASASDAGPDASPPSDGGAIASDYKFSLAPNAGGLQHYDRGHNVAINGAGQELNNNGFDQFATGYLLDGARGLNCWFDVDPRGSAFGWVGWNGGAPQVTFRFSASRTFTRVTVGMSNCDPPNVTQPTQIDVAFSADGVTFGTAISFKRSDGTLPAIPSGQRADLALNVGMQTGRYVRITALQGGSWIFLDEVGFQ